MEPYLIYGGVALVGWLLRHYGVGTSLGNNLLSMVNLQPAAPPVAAPASSASPVLTEAEAALLSLVKQLKANASTKVQADLEGLLQQALASVVSPAAASSTSVSK